MKYLDRKFMQPQLPIVGIAVIHLIFVGEKAEPLWRGDK